MKMRTEIDTVEDLAWAITETIDGKGMDVVEDPEEDVRGGGGGDAFFFDVETPKGDQYTVRVSRSGGA